MSPGRALVTGAGKRLGRAMALRLAERGYDVAIHFHASEAEAEATATAARVHGVTAATCRADLLDEGETAELIPTAAAALGGPITVLVNNASIFEYDTIGSATREGWDRHMGSNLRAPFVLIQRMAADVPEPELDLRGEPVAQGLVVNMIDQRMMKPTPGFMTYSISKAGLWWLTRTAAQALAPRLRVNAIGPGSTLRGTRQSEAHFARQRQATILQRGADEAAICGALEYLLSANAVTGQLLCVDGGQHLGWRTPDIIGPE